MKPIKNIFMCLVHENQDCIIDLVRNLHYLDPASQIILYNGGTDQTLFDHFPFERYGATIHPNPQPLKWGWLHDFALDCMEYALENFEFDLITVVDSDQLACGKDYSKFVSDVVHKNASLGMLGKVPQRLDSTTLIDPAVTAYEEESMWQLFLEQLPNGRDAFLHWTFWPSTAFTRDASADLVHLFRTNEDLKKLLKTTKIWASEEILLPTLTIALGYTIAENPCIYDFVKYREIYTKDNIKKATETFNSFWIHPVERKIDDANRMLIRDQFLNYTDKWLSTQTDPLEQLTHEIHNQIQGTEGWLEQNELKLLIKSIQEQSTRKEEPTIVEIGSYCGKGTAAIAMTAEALNTRASIIAIDDFKGVLGAKDVGLVRYPVSIQKFRQTLEKFKISDRIDVIQSTPHLVKLNKQIDLLLIDGLHDYGSVARDFYNFEKLVDLNGLILFHDYSTHFPGVVGFVDDLLLSDNYTKVESSGSMIVLQKTSGITSSIDLQVAHQDELMPLVSCIMPTYNRPEYFKQALAQFHLQDYPNKELVIIDDGDDSIANLIPEMSGIKYEYHEEKLDLGTKRNMACELAQGSIIVHLDDDDFYAPDWLSKQVDFLTTEKLEVTGLSEPIFFDTTSSVWQYTYPKQEKPWVYGATLCYTKLFWKSNPFPPVNCGEDNLFVWSKRLPRMNPHLEITSYLGRIHETNTSPKMTQDVRWKKLERKDAKRILDLHGLKK